MLTDKNRKKAELLMTRKYYQFTQLLNIQQIFEQKYEAFTSGFLGNLEEMFTDFLQQLVDHEEIALSQ